jgi:AraC-like DNA-binding protein
MQRLCVVVLDDAAVAVHVRNAGQHVGKGGFQMPESRLRTFDLDYFVEGEGVFVINGRRLSVGRGEMVLRFPGDRVSAELPVPLSVYNAHFELLSAEHRVLDLADPRDVRSLRDYLHDPAALLLPDHIAPAEPGRTVELLDAMAEDRLRAAPGARARLTAHLWLLLEHLSAEAARVLSLEGHTPEQHHQVKRARGLIEGRLHNRISLAEVARGIHVSADYLARIFRQDTGETVGQYIRARRIARAQSLLIGSSLSIKEIALRMGVPDPLYFWRVFKKATGVSPSEYRAGHRAR